ncbi:tRNA lysidine(34) synthetase TilS [Pseudodesulfovibrio sp.]|uniref:tRNA lysidine(34) synthetase TilS n=1 Tax=Pseudodesulfovibrio sp. TaxID=2035812 RepID=UPI00342188DD
MDLSKKTLISACSGGADSTALLLVLHWLASRSGGRVVGVHLDHGLRPESGDDAAFVRGLCDALGVECVVRRVDVADLAETSGVGLEEAGRNARYALFAEVLAGHGGDAVAVAHHLDDLAEDVLMRLVRGTGWPGLSGMAGYDPVRRLLRPFLLTRKAELTGLLADIGVGWREDCSNSDERWTRNRVRHAILPLLLEENPNFPEAVARLWRLGALDAGYWAEQTTGADGLLDNRRLHAAHKALRLRLYKSALDGIGGGQVLADTLFRLDTAWTEGRIGAVFQFPGDRTAAITASGVLFSAKH